MRLKVDCENMRTNAGANSSLPRVSSAWKAILLQLRRSENLRNDTALVLLWTKLTRPGSRGLRGAGLRFGTESPDNLLPECTLAEKRSRARERLFAGARR